MRSFEGLSYFYALAFAIRSQFSAFIT
jgi:hypothetical protein